MKQTEAQQRADEAQRVADAVTGYATINLDEVEIVAERTERPSYIPAQPIPVEYEPNHMLPLVFPNTKRNKTNVLDNVVTNIKGINSLNRVLGFNNRLNKEKINSNNDYKTVITIGRVTITNLNLDRYYSKNLGANALQVAEILAKSIDVFLLNSKNIILNKSKNYFEGDDVKSIDLIQMLNEYAIINNKYIDITIEAVPPASGLLKNGADAAVTPINFLLKPIDSNNDNEYDNVETVYRAALENRMYDINDKFKIEVTQSYSYYVDGYLANEFGDILFNTVFRNSSYMLEDLKILTNNPSYPSTFDDNIYRSLNSTKFSEDIEVDYRKSKRYNEAQK